MKVHHIGYLVDNIDNAAYEFENLGFVRLGEIKADLLREIYVLFLNNNSYIVELIQPISENSPIYGLRKRYRNSPYHLCYETSDIEKEIRSLRDKGYVLINELALAPAIGESTRVAFLSNGSVGMIELVEIERVTK